MKSITTSKKASTRKNVELVPVEGKAPIEELKKLKEEKVAEKETPKVVETPVETPVTPEQPKVEEPKAEAPVVEAPKTEEEVADMIIDLAKKYGVDVVETEDEEKPEDEAPIPVVELKPEAPKKVKAPKKVQAPKVETLPPTSTKTVPQVKLFPEKLDVPQIGEMTLASGKYKKVSQIRDAMEEGKIIVLANYWTKRHIKQFDYSEVFQVPLKKGYEFPNDLDLTMAIIICQNFGKMYAQSVLTEAMYSFFDGDLEEIDGVRVSNGMEFQIYEFMPPVVENEATEEQ